MLILTCTPWLALQPRMTANWGQYLQHKFAWLMNISLQRGIVRSAPTDSTMRTVSIATGLTALYADRIIFGYQIRSPQLCLALQRALRPKESTWENACTTHVARATAKTMITFNAKLCHHLWLLLVLDAQLLMERLNVRFASQDTSRQTTNFPALKSLRRSSKSHCL
jgi:hypothetical protein